MNSLVYEMSENRVKCLNNFPEPKLMDSIACLVHIRLNIFIILSYHVWKANKCSTVLIFLFENDLNNVFFKKLLNFLSE